MIRRPALVVAALLVTACSGSGGGAPPASTAAPGTTAPGTTEPGDELELPDPVTPIDADAVTTTAAADAELATVAAMRSDAGFVDLLDPVGEHVLADVDAARVEFAEAQLGGMATELGIDLAATGAVTGLRRAAATPAPADSWTGSLIGQASTTTTMSMAIMTMLVDRAADTDEGRVERNDTYRKQPIAGYDEQIDIRHQMSVRTGGGQVQGTVQITSTDVLSKDGTAVATLIGSGAGEFDLDACPDTGGIAAGNYRLAWTEEMTRNGSSSAGSAFSIAAPFRIVVGDDAHILRIETTQTASRGAHGPGSPGGPPPDPFDWGATATVAVTYARDGTRTADYEGATTSSNQATQQQLVGVLAGSAMVDLFLLDMARKAEEFWRSGKCVELTATEQSRQVTPAEVVEFDVTSAGRFDGQAIAAPIVATLQGPRSVSPDGQRQDPPAHVTFTAGDQPDDRGTVTVEQTSKRGIGRTMLDFTVEPRDLELAMTADLIATGGLAVAVAHIEIPPTLLQRTTDGTYTASEVIAHVTGTLTVPSFCTLDIDDDVVLTVILDPTTTEDTLTMEVTPDLGAAENVSLCGLASLPAISTFGIDVWAFSLLSKAVVVGGATDVPVRDAGADGHDPRDPHRTAGARQLSRSARRRHGYRLGVADVGRRIDRSGWPLVGRDDELHVAAQAIERGHGVVLLGPPGVGKTRLARELVADAERRGGRTEWIAATHAASSIPLGAVAHLVPGDTLGQARDVALRGIVTALARAGDRGPLVLGVDDAHLLDDGSAALVHQLISTGAATGVVTVRQGVPVPDAVTSLWKDGPASLIALQPLSRTELEALTTTVLGGSLDGALVERLWQSTGGNALYLRELVHDGLESGALTEVAGLWCWSGGMRLGDRLLGLLEHRMGSLDDAEHAALELVAIGEPLPIACARVLGVDQVVQRLERRGLVRSERGATIEIRLAHPLFGELLRDRMPPSRLDEIHVRLADAFDALPAPSQDDGFRADIWRAAAGDHSRPDRLRAAARRAWALWAAPTAEQLARVALDAGPDLETGHLLGEALADQGRPGEAVAAWESVEALPGPDRVRATMAHGHASILHFHLGRTLDAHEVLVRAAARVSEPDARLIIDGSMAMFRATGGGDAATHAGTEGELTGGPGGALAAAIDLLGRGRFTESRQLAERTIAGADSWVTEFPTIVLLLQVNSAWARILGGDVVDGDDDVVARYREAVAAHAHYPRSLWCLVHGMTSVLRGKPHSAGRALHEALAASPSTDTGWWRPTHAYLAMATAIAGDAPGAAEHVCRLDALNRNFDGVFGVDVIRARSWAAAAGGELTAALAFARDAATLAASTGRSAFEAFALHDIARFGDPAGAADRITELGDVVDGPLVGALGEHCRALATDDGDDLDRAAERLASIGLDLFAAEAGLSAARRHRRDGRRASAQASLERARQASARTEATRTAALVTDDLADDLTPREREVAELAASGLASREIAARLGITQRTVDNMLGRVYVKFGIANRAALGAILRPNPR